MVALIKLLTLVGDKEKAKRKYKNAMVDTISIEDMLLMYVKGEQSNEESHFKRFI